MCFPDQSHCLSLSSVSMIMHSHGLWAFNKNIKIWYPYNIIGCFQKLMQWICVDLCNWNKLFSCASFLHGDVISDTTFVGNTTHCSFSIRKLKTPIVLYWWIEISKFCLPYVFWDMILYVALYFTVCSFTDEHFCSQSCCWPDGFCYPCCYWIW